MKLSASLELLKFFQREGITHFGNPYIEFADVPIGPAIVHTASVFFGLLTRVRLTVDGGRWLILWHGSDAASTVDPHAILALLEGVVAGNRVGIDRVFGTIRP